MEFIEKHFQFLRSIKKIRHNTVCKYLAYVKIVITSAVYVEVLTQEEIDKIAKLELKELLQEKQLSKSLFYYSLPAP